MNRFIFFCYRQLNDHKIIIYYSVRSLLASYHDEHLKNYRIAEHFWKMYPFGDGDASGYIFQRHRNGVWTRFGSVWMWWEAVIANGSLLKQSSLTFVSNEEIRKFCSRQQRCLKNQRSQSEWVSGSKTERKKTHIAMEVSMIDRVSKGDSNEHQIWWKPFSHFKHGAQRAEETTSSRMKNYYSLPPINII